MDIGKTRIVKIGELGVDSGQLIICDPSYIEGQFQSPDNNGESDHAHDVYQHVDDGKLWQFTYGEKSQWGVNPFPGTYDVIIPEYGLCPNSLIWQKKFVIVEIDPTPHIKDGEFSYRGICKATNGENQSGQLNYTLGHAGVAVAFKTGFGDGTYGVFAEFIQTKYGERIKKVWVELITEKEEQLMDELISRQK